MPKICINCGSSVDVKKGRYCKVCVNKRERRRHLENGLEREPYKYVECSGDDCLNIWTLKKKKLVNGRREGLSQELYKRSKCPKCNSTAICFLNGGKFKGEK